MISFEQMLLRLVIALALGALMGLEREVIGKEAGIRTTMTVAGGAAVFSIIAVILPYVVAVSPQNLTDILAHNGGYFSAIANIVVGIGFLGAGIILKTSEHVHGLTTAAVVWAAAAVGTLAGIGQLQFALATAVIVSGLLYLLRKFGLTERIRPGENNNS